METKDEDVFEPRPENDMMRRRFSNFPNPLQKKKLETYKKFITPTNYDPISYVQHHRKMSKSTSNLAEELKNQQDQQERNSRYEELQKVKQQLKEEEETWTSNLADWKNRRRSVTSGLRERKSMREEVEKKVSSTKLRRMKTYNEMLEEKRQREFLFDDNFISFDILKSEKEKERKSPPIFSSSSNKEINLSDNVPEAPPRTSSKSKVRSPRNIGENNQKKLYSGAISQPLSHSIESLKNHRITHPEDKISSSYANFDNAATNKAPKKHPLLKQQNIDDYKSKITAEPVNYEKTNNESRVKAKTLQHNFNNNRSQTLPKQTDEVFNDRKKELRIDNSTIKNNAENIYNFSNKPSNDDRTTISNSNIHSVGPAQRKVVMRKKNNQSYNNKTRPVSDYSGLNKTMLLGNKSTDSLKKSNRLPSNYHEYNSSKLNKFVANRKSMFANKLNLWQQKSLDSTNIKTFGNDPPKLSTLIQRDSQSSNININENNSRLNTKSWRKSTPDLGLNIKDPKVSENNLHKETPKSYTPIVSIDNKTIGYSKTKPLNIKAPLNDAQNKNSNLINQSEFDDASDHEDMRICINQRPKSGKGFGFTVRGGEEGRPVVVDTVQSGGAADVCNLCVGDTITHINKVELVSLNCQDDIVQLIVESIISGKLALNIRRKKLGYKSLDNFHKPTNENISTKNEKPDVEKHTYGVPSLSETKPPTPPPLPPLSDASSADFPLPPIDLMSPGDEQFTEESFKNDSNWRDNYYEDSNFSSISSCDDLQNEILDINHELQTEHQLLKTPKFHEQPNSFQQKLLDDQKKLDEEEAIRNKMRRMRKLQEDEENRKVQLQLNRIESENKEHLKKQEAERKQLIENSFNFVAQPRHWMIEEAERRRKAENEGKYRNIFNEENTFEHATNERREIADDQPASRARATLL